MVRTANGRFTQWSFLFMCGPMRTTKRNTKSMLRTVDTTERGCWHTIDWWTNNHWNIQYLNRRPNQILKDITTILEESWKKTSRLHRTVGSGRRLPPATRTKLITSDSQCLPTGRTSGLCVGKFRCDSHRKGMKKKKINKKVISIMLVWLKKKVIAQSQSRGITGRCAIMRAHMA